MTETHWTAKLVDERFEEAADTLRRLPERNARGYFSTWPAIIRDFVEAYGWQEVRVRLGPPHPAAIDRMHEAFGWLSWLEPDETRLVWLRAEGVRWKIVAVRYGVDRATVWRRWTCALIKIASRLNGARATNSLQQFGTRRPSRESVV